MNGTGVALLVLVFALNVAAFAGLRAGVARGSGLRFWRAAFGLDPRPWPWPRRLAFVLAGPLGCYLIASLLMAAGALAGGDPVIDTTSMRVEPLPGSPAEAAGIRPGDRVLEIEGRRVSDWGDLIAATGTHAGDDIAVVIERGGSPLTVSVTVSTAGKVGMRPPQGTRSAGEAIVRALSHPALVEWEGAKGLIRLVRGKESAEVSGPVGIVRAVESTEARGEIGDLLRFLGTVNAYFLWIPTIVALALFPRAGRRKAVAGMVR